MVAAVIAVGSAGVILLTGDETASTTPTAASSGSASASGGDSVAITIEDFMFDPEPLEVEAGAKAITDRGVPIRTKPPRIR